MPNGNLKPMYKQAQQFLQYIQGIEQDKLAQWSAFGLLILLSYSAAVTTWETVSLLRGPDDTVVIGPPSAQKTSRQTSRQPPAAGGLFGTAGSLQDAATAAPDTSLNLSLTGVIAADDPSIALAFIRVAGGDEKSYAINEQVAGGAVVKEIHPDRVILSRNGRFETLRMPQSFGGIVLQDETSPKSVSVENNTIQTTVTTQEVKQYKQKLLTAPNELAGLIRQRPVKRNGKITGYRLFPGSDRELFNRLGLKPGDIVTAVNGLPLTDPASAMELYGQLPTMGQLSIKLERGGQPMDLVLPWQ
ncbi:MAG: type II secretion system protein GspC [Gammaproteobacteria bacterium]|nr:type II secretion system protein GspC [Gammaproteobacteria bacterium]